MKHNMYTQIPVYVTLEWKQRPVLQKVIAMCARGIIQQISCIQSQAKQHEPVALSGECILTLFAR